MVFRPKDAEPLPSPEIDAAAWRVLSPAPDPEGGGDEITRRFRLAGTLFGFGVGSAEAPQAILDDKLLVVQRLVRRGDEVAPGVRLLEVRTDSVVLEGSKWREELHIERISGASSGARTPAIPGAEIPLSASEAEDRFGGRRVFPGRWEFDRQALLRYYSELRDEPERLLAVFDSMEPLYQDNDPGTQTITGYRLNVRGEAPFFAAMGILPGDVVRSVNAVAMSNRRRAEAFIRAFVESDEDTFVIEVEREGTTTKQVYIVR